MSVSAIWRSSSPQAARAEPARPRPPARAPAGRAPPARRGVSRSSGPSGPRSRATTSAASPPAANASSVRLLAADFGVHDQQLPARAQVRGSLGADAVEDRPPVAAGVPRPRLTAGRAAAGRGRRAGWRGSGRSVSPGTAANRSPRRARHADAVEPRVQAHVPAPRGARRRRWSATPRDASAALRPANPGPAHSSRIRSPPARGLRAAAASNHVSERGLNTPGKDQATHAATPFPAWRVRAAPASWGGRRGSRGAHGVVPGPWPPTVDSCPSRPRPCGTPSPIRPATATGSSAPRRSATPTPSSPLPARSSTTRSASAR